MKKIMCVFLLVVLLVVVSCEYDDRPRPDSDSQQNYAAGSHIPVDDSVYVISGVVAGDVDSLVRQTSPAHGGLVGTALGTAGSYFGPEFGGKGFVRLYVTSVVPPTDTIAPHNIAIVKTSDTKAVVLVPGDRVVFKCRRQYEAVAAMRNGEAFDDVKVGTWEIDYCRLASPVIKVGEE